MATALHQFKTGIYDEYLHKILCTYREQVIRPLFGDDPQMDNLKEWVESGPNYNMMAFFSNYVINRFKIQDRIYAKQDDIALISSDYTDYLRVPDDYRFELNYRFSTRSPTIGTAWGTASEIYEKIVEETTEKKVFLNFSSYGVYTGGNIKYSGYYSRETMELIVKNAGWICWNIKKMNEIMCG